MQGTKNPINVTIGYVCSEHSFEECHVSNIMQRDEMCVYLQKGLSVEATLWRVDAKSLQHLQVNGSAEFAKENWGVRKKGCCSSS